MRARLTLTAVLFTTVLVTMPWLIDTAECAVVTDGLISYWTFDNAHIDGITVNDVWGENHGTFVGRAEIIDRGKFGNALDPIPGHVEFDDSNLPDRNDPRTLSAWVNLDSVPQACGSVFQWGSLNDTKISGMMVCNGGTGFFVGGHADMQSDGTMERGVWNYITITYDGKLLRIYINGEFDKKDPPGLKWGNQPRKLNTVLGIGKIGALWNGDEGDEGFTAGLIDEVSIYDRTLSADEVEQNFNAGGLAVNAAGKLALTWGGIKLSRFGSMHRFVANYSKTDNRLHTTAGSVS